MAPGPQRGLRAAKGSCVRELRTDRPDGDGPPPTGRLVEAALNNDSAAWEMLIERHLGLVWAVPRSMGLARTDAADVVQTVWLRLVEHLDRLREPDRLASWLVTTARRETLRALRVGGRELLVEPPDLPEEPLAPLPPNDPALAVEADEELHELLVTIESLPERCRLLLRTLAAAPSATYAEIAAALDMPIGSIGPTRERCRQRLLRELADDGERRRARRRA